MADFSRPFAYTIWRAHTVSSGEAAAGTLNMYIYSGGSKEDFQFVGQARRANEDLYGLDWTYASGTGIITIANNTESLTEDDVLTCIGSFGNLE